ncbi:MAG: lysophospholipid acyltransferase family protein [Bacilli bacterium]
MLTLILFILAVIATFFMVYFHELSTSGILYWTIPLYLIGFFLAFFILFLLILYIITWFIKPDKKLERPKPFYQFFIKMTCEFLVGVCRLDLVVLNKEAIPKDRTFLMVSNHQSNLDPIVSVWAFRNYNLTYIMKDSIMKIPLVGRFLYGGGFLPLNRKNNRKALKTILIATKRVADGVHPIALYPEGTRSKSPTMNEFRNGAFKIAQKSECPIVVMTLDPTYMFKRQFPLKRTKILLDIVRVIEYAEYDNMSTNEIGDWVHTLIENRLEVRRKEFSWLQTKKTKALL